MTEPTLAQPVVHIIDDDPSVRRALSRLMRLEGWATRTYSSGTDFVESPRPNQPSCIVLDVRLPGIDGIAVQEMLQAEGSKIATIIITANLDPHVRELARKAGANDFCTKPFDEVALLEAIRRGLECEHREGPSQQG